MIFGSYDILVFDNMLMVAKFSCQKTVITILTSVRNYDQRFRGRRKEKENEISMSLEGFLSISN